MYRTVGSQCMKMAPRALCRQPARTYWRLPIRYGGFGPRFSMWPMDRLMDRHMRHMEKMAEDFWKQSPWCVEWSPRAMQRSESKAIASVQGLKYTDKEFELRLNVSEFKPEDLEVKVTKEKLTLSGKQEEQQDDHGLVSRQFTREFALPENVDVDSMETMLTEDGLLVIRAQVKGRESKEKATKLKIQFQKDKPKQEDAAKSSEEPVKG